LTKPFSAAWSLGSFISAVAEFVSLMAKKSVGHWFEIGPTLLAATMWAQWARGKYAL
jgi:hypothetical protein